MDAAVDDGVDVISMSFNGTEESMAFHDDAVTAPSYSAIAQGVLVCTPAASSSPDMFRVESNVPWLLTVAASDAGRRVVTNVELGSGVLKPDVGTPCANTLAVAPHGGGVEYTDTQIMVATSLAAAHGSGVAALIKKAHREWSPAAIKLAIVTTADPVGTGDAMAGDGAGYFVTGAGEVNPTKAMESWTRASCMTSPPVTSSRIYAAWASARIGYARSSSRRHKPRARRPGRSRRRT